MEQRACAECSEIFVVDPRAVDTHLYCPRPQCQRVRRARNQRERRARRRNAKPPPSPAHLKRRAAFMRLYRAENP